MALPLPLSAEAQSEARVLMLAANHILAPKDGKPIIVPTQDMVLGAYFLTLVNPAGAGAGRVFSSYEEALLANAGAGLHLQAPIKVRVYERGGVISYSSEPGFMPLLVETTVGRMIFNEILPGELRYFKGGALGELTGDDYDVGPRGLRGRARSLVLRRAFLAAPPAVSCFGLAG